MRDPFAGEGRRHPPAECARLLDQLLLDPRELLAELAPEGWERSPLRHVFHPTSEQLQKERVRIRERLAELRDAVQGEGADPDRPLDQPAADPVHGQEPASRPTEDDGPHPAREIVELLGYALWDVFSHNHTVVDAEGTTYELGTFRRSAGFIAESINRRYTDLPARYTYLDFYMGSAMISDRADLTPVYRWIFARLQAKACRWIYSFPRLYLVDPGGPAVEEPSGYDPGEAVRRQLEQEARDENVRELKERLERSHEEAVRRARHEPLPETVQAYRDVFGVLPDGWPHPQM